MSLSLYHCVDFYRYFEREQCSCREFKKLPPEVKWLYYWRKLQNNNYNPFVYKWYLYQFHKLSLLTHIQVGINTSIGKGLYIGHLGRVIINSEAKLGNNVNIATGVTIGQENRGERKGFPIIGNNVWIGTNSVIVGKITIGDDVLIAPLTFVNFDVPSKSIVIGNPARIIPNKNATEGYISRKIIDY